MRALVAAVALAAAACAAARAGTQATPGAGPSTGALLYVTNQDGAAASVIDAERLEVVARVDFQAMGFGPQARPHDIAVEPDGSYWYVSLIGEDRVLKLDRDHVVVGQVEIEVPGLVVLHPTEDLLLVGRSMAAVDPPSAIAVIRRSDMTLIDELDVVFPRPHALAVRPQGDRAYAASLAVNRMAVIEPLEGRVELREVPAAAGAAGVARAGADAAHAAHAGADTAHVSPNPAHAPHTLVEFAIAPDSRTMVAAGELSGQLLVFDLAEPAAPRLLRTVSLGGAPWHPAFTPDGRRVYVPLHRENAVAVVDAASWEVVARIEGRGLAQPHQAVPSPDGRLVFVSNHNTSGQYVSEGGETDPGTVVVIDAAANAIVDVIEVGPNATGMDVAPRPATAR